MVREKNKDSFVLWVCNLTLQTVTLRQNHRHFRVVGQQLLYFFPSLVSTFPSILELITLQQLRCLQ